MKQPYREKKPQDPEQKQQKVSTTDQILAPSFEQAQRRQKSERVPQTENRRPSRPARQKENAGKEPRIKTQAEHAQNSSRKTAQSASSMPAKRTGRSSAPKPVAPHTQKESNTSKNAPKDRKPRAGFVRKETAKKKEYTPTPKTQTEGKIPAVPAVRRKNHSKDVSAEQQIEIKEVSALPTPVPNPEEKKPAKRGKSTKRAPLGKLKIISLGGLSEIGKNMTVLEYENDIIIVDCGLGFPDEDMLGIDLVIPDITYLEKNAEKIRGIFITHGHEDHIGAVPYVLRSLHVPIYATRLTVGILKNKLAEHSYSYTPTLQCVSAGSVISAGAFSVEFIRVNHSIADACCLAIRTPLGTIVHSGDFKLDLTPIEGEVMDLARLGQLGKEGVLMLLCESTNAERPGYTPSERTVGASFEHIFLCNKDKRIVIATFSSNVHRVQQIINVSAAYGRKVAITGRSMLNIVGAAVELGYMKVPEGVLIDIHDIKRYPKEQVTLITTGSQGEPMSALYRMTYADHDQVTLDAKDLVVISAHAIPGNEKLVDKIINELCRRGIPVFRDAAVDVHVSGHACQEELKLMHALTRPRYFMPIHGEYKHLVKHKEIAMYMGMPADRIFISDIGKVLEIDENGVRFNGVVPSGNVLVDGYGVGDVGNIVLRERRHLAEDGVIIVVAAINTQDATIISGPDIVSRGFVYVREAEALMDEIKHIARKTLEGCLAGGYVDWPQMKNSVKEELSRYLYNKTKRKPMILSIIMNA